jgi:hypothetical protein
MLVINKKKTIYFVVFEFRQIVCELICFQTLSKRVDGPFNNIVHKINENSYKVELPGIYMVSQHASMLPIFHHIGMMDLILNSRVSSIQPEEYDID